MIPEDTSFILSSIARYRCANQTDAYRALLSPVNAGDIVKAELATKGCKDFNVLLETWEPRLNRKPHRVSLPFGKR